MPKFDLSKSSAGALLKRAQGAISGVMEEAGNVYHKSNNGLAQTVLSQNTPDKSVMGYDAFRHAYASARLVQDTGETVANSLGRAWEGLAAVTRENNNENENKADIGMDLHNNRVGREIARKLGPSASSEDLVKAIGQAGQNGELILSTKDPRAMEEFNRANDMRVATAAREGYDLAKDTIAAGAVKASDLVKDLQGSVSKSLDNAKESLDKGIDKVIESLKDALDKAPSASFFKFSEAQLEEGAKFAEVKAPELASRLAQEVAVADEWQMAAKDFEAQTQAFDGKSSQLASLSLEDNADANPRSSLDDPSTQTRVAMQEREREAEHELEASMDA